MSHAIRPYRRPYRKIWRLGDNGHEEQGAIAELLSAERGVLHKQTVICHGWQIRAPMDGFTACLR